jgi:hypothetical protein
MLTSEIIKVPIVVALGVVAGVLAISVITSLLIPKREEPSS